MPEQRVYQWLHYKLYCFGAQFAVGLLVLTFADKMKVEWSKVIKKMVGAPWDGGTLNNQPHIHLISRGYFLGTSPF